MSDLKGTIRDALKNRVENGHEYPKDAVSLCEELREHGVLEGRITPATIEAAQQVMDEF